MPTCDMRLGYYAGLLLMLALSACSGRQGPHAALSAADWQQYKQHFVAPEGRVIDNRNGNISHSEGQGYGMILAAASDDRQSFDRIWHWTRQHLQVRKRDRLHAWKWSPDKQVAVDMNNATDGDILIAWALLRANRKWPHAAYQKAAGEILASLKKLQVSLPAGRFLLPGAKGFGGRHASVLNPSYFLFPAYRDFAAEDKGMDWQGLIRDARQLLKRSTFGYWRLPGNWLKVDGRVRLAAGREPYFGYDAMRIPLFAAWGGERALLTPYVAFWDQFSMRDSVPDQVDLMTDFVHMDAQFSAVRSIAAVSRHALGRRAAGSFPALTWAPDTAYYDASLSLLSQLAWIEFDEQQELSR
ncbi:MAG: glycosyl hydrolase family 8 [Mariprofundaceae bacterium]